jgi:hypothetical protein
MNTSYEHIPPFDQLYLEDSYVLGVEENDQLTFDIDAVLTERSPHYRPAKPGEQYCYSRVRLTFPNAREVMWRSRSFTPSIDANDEVDYGNIDAFELTDSGTYRLEGDWGEVELRSDPPTLEYL